MAPIIEIENLSKRFGDNLALNQFHLQLPPQTIFGFLGENGAGKTTTIKLMLGLLTADEGHIRLFGQDLGQHRQHLMRRLGALIEAPSYYSHLSARDNLRILIKLRGLSQKSIDKALDTVALLDRADKKVSTFSHGMCQRLGIAMAILGEPELVILDEPTNGLDPSGIRDMRQLIQSLPERFGTTVFISSHLLSEVEQIAHRVGILKKGRLLFDGNLDTLRDKAGEHILIRTSQVSAAAAILAEFPSQQDPDQNLLIVDAEIDHIADITQRLVAEAIPILEMRGQKPNLEDLYFKLIEAEPA